MMRRQFGIFLCYSWKFFCLFFPPVSIWILLTENFFRCRECFDAWQMKIDLFLNLFVEFLGILLNVFFCVLWTSWKVFYLNSFCTNSPEKIPNGAILLLQIFLKSLMMRNQTYFIDFQWWWKSFKMSKYWSLLLKMDNHSYFVSSTTQSLPNYAQLISNQYSPHDIYGERDYFCIFAEFRHVPIFKINFINLHDSLHPTYLRVKML